MRYLVLSIIFLSTHFTSNAQFGKLVNKAKSSVAALAEDNTSLGLKEALNTGVSSAVSTLSAEGGYLNGAYKIAIPDEAQKIISVVKKVPGFQDVEVKLINQMNQAAEFAAKEATPIFVNAIKNMSFTDAKNILFGADNAATIYLETNTKIELYTAFLPVIQKALDQVNARTYWTSVVNAYNSVPFQRKLNPDLDDHVNNKALDGLFGLIQVKEAGIRTDVNQRTSPLLKDVFGKQDKK